MTGIAISCTEDIANKIANDPLIKGRIFTIYSEEELIERTKAISFPCVGVVYDGITAVGEAGTTGKQGLSTELTVSLMVFFRQNTRATNDPKLTMVDLMDRLRELIIATRSPSGHLWKFKVEVPVQGKNGILAYIQRWSTPVQLTPTAR
jgi:hypothetical protein